MTDITRPQRTYLGDGLYVEFDGYQFALITNDGIGDLQTVYLDLGVLEKFLAFAKLHIKGLNVKELN